MLRGSGAQRQFLEFPVHLPAVPDSHDHDHEHLVADLVDDAVVPHPDAVQILLAGESLYAAGSGVSGQGVDLRSEASLDILREATEVAVRSRSEIDPVGLPTHLEPQILLDLPPGDRAFLVGLFQGCPGLVQIDAGL